VTGGRIVFLHQPPEGPVEYAAIDLDRGGLNSLGPVPESLRWGFQPHSARLSPEGTRIAFGKAVEIEVDGHKGVTSPNKIQIHPLNAKAGADVVVDMPGAGIDHWYWSPDGSKLAFSSWEKQRQPRNWLVDVMTRETKEVPLPRYKTKDTEYPMIIEGWSPDGAWFLASGNGLYLVKPDGSESRQIVSADRLAPGLLGGSCRFSPDGRQVLCVSADGARTSLLLAEVASGKVRVLGHGAGLVQACWSPDGRRIACSMTAWEEKDNRAGETSLIVTDIETNDTRRVLTDQSVQGWLALLGWLPPAAPRGIPR
jgi:Tol biopolymer transport system component